MKSQYTYKWYRYGKAKRQTILSSLMPSSHLPRTPCDKFVYDFPCEFLGIVGGYTGYGIGVHIVYGHCAISSTGPRGQPVTTGVNPYRDCAEIVRKSCNASAVAVQSRQPPHGNLQSPCGDRASHGAGTRAGIVQCHLRHVYGLWAYDLFPFKFVKLHAKPNRRGRGACESVQNLTAASCLRVEASGGRTERGIRAGYRFCRPITSQM